MISIQKLRGNYLPLSQKVSDAHHASEHVVVRFRDVHHYFLGPVWTLGMPITKLNA